MIRIRPEVKRRRSKTIPGRAKTIPGCSTCLRSHRSVERRVGDGDVGGRGLQEQRGRRTRAVPLYLAQALVTGVLKDSGPVAATQHDFVPSIDDSAAEATASSAAKRQDQVRSCWIVGACAARQYVRAAILTPLCSQPLRHEKPEVILGRGCLLEADLQLHHRPTA
jgi:hypothetical protein